MGRGGIPERWLPYTPMGSMISGTRFVACKVPLKEALLRNLPEKDRFGPKDLFKAFPNIGLLVDLTNTDRYYEKQEFTKQNIQYEKIHCPGRVIPPNSVVEKFFMIVDTYLDKNKNSDSAIVVHCTHGVNRTGYFICRYMIEKMEIPPDEAINRVQQARGHKIERQNYVRDLSEGCKGGSEADMRFAPKARNMNKWKNDRHSTARNMRYSSRSRTGRRALEPEGRSSSDNWRVRGPPVDSRDKAFSEYDDHAVPSRGYPLNCPSRTPLLDDPYIHRQPHSKQRGPLPDSSWAKDSTNRKPSQNQSNLCTRQGFQEHVSGHQLSLPWEVRGPPVDSWDKALSEYDDHAVPSRGYPLNRPPKTPLLDDPYSHRQPQPKQRGPDLSRAKYSTNLKPSQNQSNFCTRQGFQEYVSDHQLSLPYQKQRDLPLPQPESQQRLVPDKGVSMSNGLTGQSNFRKQSSFEHSFPKQPVPFPRSSISQQLPRPPFQSRPPFSCHYKSSPESASVYSTPSVPQQAGPRPFNSRQSSPWNPLPSFVKTAPSFH